MREWTGHTGGIEIIGTFVRETVSAVCVRISSIDEQEVSPPHEKWLPFSQIESSRKDGTSYKCIIATWLGNKIAEEIV